MKNMTTAILKTFLLGNIFYVVVFFLNISVLTSSCQKNPTKIEKYEWKSLGFEDKFALRMVLAEPYLYVCAGSDGLWRRNIRESGGDWEYLGLADTSLEKGRGVQDVVVHLQNTNWLLVAFDPSPSPNDHTIYRSLDGGKNWAPADSGLENYYGGERYISRIKRFLQYPDRILGLGFITTNFGDYWQKIEIPQYLGMNVKSLVHHPKHSNIIWAGGRGLLDHYVLGCSTDSGLTWQAIYLGDNVPTHINAVFSIAFDVNNPNVVYVGLASDLVKTTDGGQSWVVLNLKEFHSFKVLSDPGKSNHLWTFVSQSHVSIPKLVETWDGGETWTEIESPNETQVLDLIYDSDAKTLYIGSETGVFVYRP